MTIYVEVAQALVRAGYLSDADVDAAAAVLVNTMRVADAQKAEAAAIDDKIYRESLSASARAEIAAAAEMGDYDDEAYQRSVIEAAEDREDEDEATINSTRAIMAAAYDDAAAGLAAAGLVDGASVDDVAGEIARVWVAQPR